MRRTWHLPLYLSSECCVAFSAYSLHQRKSRED